MTNSAKPIRLSKAAREFNVGKDTIVDFLKKKGYELDSNPNTKLDSDMYGLLHKEYSKEKTVKEEAKRHSLKYTKRKSISLEDEQKEAEKQDPVKADEPEEDDFEDTIFIKNSSSWAKGDVEKTEQKGTNSPDVSKPEKEVKAPVIKAEEKPEAIKKEEKPADNIEEKPDVKGPKVLGKVDLDVVNPPKKKAVQKKAEQKAPEVKTVEKPVTPPPVVEKPQKEAAVEKKPAVQTPKTTETVSKKPEVKAEQKPKKPQKQAETVKEKKVLSVPEKKTVKEEAKKDTPAVNKPKPEIKKQPKAEAPTKEHKKVEHKPKAELQQNTAKKTIEQPKAEKPKQPEEENNFIKTKVEKLNGPTILGSIELPTTPKKSDKKKPDQRRNKDNRNKKAGDPKQQNDPNKKKPVASSTDDSVRPKKKKRKRITTTSTDNKNKNTNQNNQNRGGDNRNQRGKTGNNKNTRKPPIKKRHEPTEEEVQKQLKETLARLSGGGGKSKTSKHRRQKREQIRTQQEAENSQQEKKTIQATEFVTVNELATMMDVNVNQVISTCMSLGLFVSINQRIDAETINMVAVEFGFEVDFVSVEVQEALDTYNEKEEISESDLTERPPIVTVMGHVDHGKTSLLDHIRKSNVISGEAGGITQHIGAYEVKTKSGKKITFLDTPGHEAFTAMRARGAQVTDVAIIVIAADDKIMPQTIEAINHAQAAGVPIVFAINKIDKPGANPDRIKEELSQRNILVEAWGGKYQSHDISAKNGIGMDDLLEKVILESEMLELQGNPVRHALGTVIESSLDKGRGYVAKLLVQDGSLKKGDFVLAGSNAGKVKAMYNERNQIVDQVGPSTPVLMLGLDGAPQAGDQFNVLEDEREAKEIALKRRQLQREQGMRTQKHITLDEIGRRIAVGDFKELNIIVKGDVDGSVEALSDSLLKQSTDEVQLNVIHKSVGQISESDVMLASASDAIIVGFQVRPSVAARRLAEKEQIDIRAYSVIYKAIEEIKAAMEGMLSPDIEEKIICNIEVRETFKITKVGTIAGCMVLDGVINRNTKVRIIRDGIVVYTGKLGSLKRFKDDVREVKTGYECGLNIENFNDIKVGDIVEGYEEVEVARKL